MHHLVIKIPIVAFGLLIIVVVILTVLETWKVLQIYQRC